jgi:hypothetical protein
MCARYGKGCLHYSNSSNLQLVSRKTKSKDRRKALREKSQVLLPLFLARDGPFYGHEEEILLIEYVAEECA